MDTARINNLLKEALETNKLDLTIYSISTFLDSFDNKHKKLEIFKLMVDGNFFKKSDFIYVIFENLSDDEKSDFLDILMEYDAKNDDIKIVDMYDISKIIMMYEKENRLDIFKKYVLAGKMFNHIGVINYFTDVNFKFETLNLKLSELLLNCDDKRKEEIFNTLFDMISNYENNVPNGDVVYETIINLYAASLGINKDNLTNFIKKFGYVTLRYLDNDNIINVINLEKSKFDKFMSLFEPSSFVLDDNTRNDVVNAILQREFRVQCKKEYNIGSRLQDAIKRSDMDEVQDIFLEISSVINVKKILEKHGIDVKKFFDLLLSNESDMLDILREITNQYIMKKREMYVNGRLVKINDELNLDKKYEKNFIKKKWIATTSEFIIIWDISTDINKDVLSSEQRELLKHEDIMREIIRFRKEPKSYVLSEEYKKYLTVFDSLLDILYVNNKLKDPTNDPNARYVYSSKVVGTENFIDLISELDIKRIDEFLLSDSEKLEKLRRILFKYKLLGWGNTFDNFRESADFEFSNITMAGLLNCFYQFESELFDGDGKKFSVMKMVSLANCSASDSSKYSLLYGSDVYRLVAANEGKNKASMVKYKRLELGLDHILGMYQRELVPVPSMDDDIVLGNGKKMNIVVGNTTDMRNLVLGEMTNSCMRIGGAFYDFYKECLEGENGFHIVFSVPGTEKFISRVSGIRNGNTLFLNELRESECSEYDDADCVSAIREVARLLVEKSGDSDFPIDNVVITADLAMSMCKDEMIDLNLSDREEALFGLHHNLDKNGQAILLASSNEDNSLVDIELGKDKISYYRPARCRVREFVGNDAVKRVIQLQMLLNNMLNGVDLADIEVDLNLDVVRCISGSDWFVSIDSKGNIHRFVLDNGCDRERALVEMNEYMKRPLSSVIGMKKGVAR